MLAAAVASTHLLVVAPSEWLASLEGFVAKKRALPWIAGCALASVESLESLEALEADQPGDGGVGDALIHAVTRYIAEEKPRELQPTESWYPPSIYFRPMKFVLLVDPSARVGERHASGAAVRARASRRCRRSPASWRRTSGRHGDPLLGRG